MATLMIRDLDDGVKARLRIQAAQHGRSMEAEARAILAEALDGQRARVHAEISKKGLGSYIHEMFAEVGGVELDIPARTDLAGQVDFGDDE